MPRVKEHLAGSFVSMVVYGALPQAACVMVLPALNQAIPPNTGCSSLLPSHAADSPEMYLGLLAPAEEYNMCEPIALLSNNHFKQTRDRFFTPCCSYGYLTNTKVKLVAVLDDPDAGIKMKNVCRSPFHPPAPHALC